MGVGVSVGVGCSVLTGMSVGVAVGVGVSVGVGVGVLTGVGVGGTVGVGVPCGPPHAIEHNATSTRTAHFAGALWRIIISNLHSSAKDWTDLLAGRRDCVLAVHRRPSRCCEVDHLRHKIGASTLYAF